MLAGSTSSTSHCAMCFDSLRLAFLRRKSAEVNISRWPTTSCWYLNPRAHLNLSQDDIGSAGSYRPNLSSKNSCMMDALARTERSLCARVGQVSPSKMISDSIALFMGSLLSGLLLCVSLSEKQQRVTRVALPSVGL